MKENKISHQYLYILVIFIALVASIIPIDFQGIENYSKAEEISNLEIAKDSTVVWDSNQNINGTVTIKYGGTLIIKNGVTISFGQLSHIVVNGKLFVNGTVKNPIYFKRADPNFGYSIWINQGGKALIKNADVSGAGTQIYQVRSNVPFVNTAYAGTYHGGFSVNGGELEIQGSKIHNSKYGIGIEYGADPEKVIVQRSSFINNETNVYNDSIEIQYADKYANFKYNWWESADGPTHTCEGSYCYYEKMYGKIDFSNWRVTEDFHDPVIIVPGILGSWKLTDNGDWKMDPIFKAYDSLINTFKDNGYEEGKDLFLLPYQWRADNIDTAGILQEKIRKIKEDNNWPKVDVVAHSMGGLVARQYIESNDYQNDIDQLIMLGTPNEGSPENYLTWAGGELSASKFDVVGIILNKIFKQEAKENGSDNIFEYLHNKPIKSIQELLATSNYLYDTNSNKVRSYQEGDFYPKNDFIDNLNLSENLQKLNKVSLINIVGKLDKSTTINEIKVGKPSIDATSQWAYGEPIKNGLTYSEGDGTVPLNSAEGVSSDEQIEINSAHMQLPGEAQDIVYKSITGYLPQKKIPLAGINQRLFFFALSLIDIQIIAPDGVHWIGKNIKNLKDEDQIEGAFYTGSETENEFVSIPNPEPGEYTVVRQGTGNGEYTVEMSNIQEAQDGSGQASESTTAITGNTSEGKEEESNVKVSSLIMNDENTAGTNDDSSDDDSEHSNKSKKKKSTSSSDISSASGTTENSLILEKWNIDQKLFPNKNVSNFNINKEDEKGETLDAKNPIDQNGRGNTFFWRITVGFLVVLAVLLGRRIYLRRRKNNSAFNSGINS